MVESKLHLPNHKGARIAIFASGPSLVEGVGKWRDYDVGIAVNAAIRQEGISFQYFVSNHGYAHSQERGWKELLQAKNGLGNGVAILMNSLSATHWERIIPDAEQRQELQTQYTEFMKEDPRTTRLTDGGFDDGKQVNNYFTLDESIAQPPHCIYNKIPIPEVQGNLLDETSRIIDGASSAGAAIHIATLMGAVSLDLYGVQMTNDQGGNYAMALDPAERGRSSPTQRANLERVLQEAHERGIEVRVHGEHAFTNDFLK